MRNEIKKNPFHYRAAINTLSMAINNLPQTLTLSSKDEKNFKHKNPKNIISGVGYGGLAFIKGIAEGVTGIIYQPYIGARKKGVSGAIVGVGKGIIGIVAKPVAGTVGLVGCTV